MPPDDVSKKTITFRAADGYVLEGELTSGEDPRTSILISAGTGFPKTFYASVARYFANKGATVLTYDYRGIGGSKHTALAGSQIDYPDWGRLDMPAALDALSDAWPDLPIAHLGHSIGGSFVGLMRNHGRVSRLALVAAGSGNWRTHSFSRLPLEMYFWWMLGPYSLATLGYIGNVGGWRGAHLPPKVFTTWRRWSHTTGFFRDELKRDDGVHYFDEIETPTRSWRFSDDGIATDAATREVLDCYGRLESDMNVRVPREIGVKRIGHEGAFRAGREALWEEWWSWLGEGQVKNTNA